MANSDGGVRLPTAVENGEWRVEIAVDGGEAADDDGGGLPNGVVRLGWELGVLEFGVGFAIWELGPSR